MGRAIVLDLDETLMHCLEINREEFDQLIEVPGVRDRLRVIQIYDPAENDSEPQELYIILRPYLKEFLQECFKKFHRVIVWTAASHSYAWAVSREIFQLVGKYPDLILDREHSQMSQQSGKPLEFLRQKYPELGLTHSMIHFDDQARNFKNNPEVGAIIRPYDPSLSHLLEGIDPDTTLLGITEYFDTFNFYTEFDGQPIDSMFR